MARPKLDIDEKVVETMAKIGATNCEIADHFGVNEGLIRKRFSEILTKARAGKKIRLRQLQWKSAESGNVVMQIWLGKQMLGQSEKIESKEIINQTVKFNDLEKLEDSQLTEEYKKAIK